MAEGDELDMVALEAKCVEFIKLANPGKPCDPKLMNNKACAKMVKDSLPKEMATIVDASVFPKHKEKGKQ